MKIIKLLSFFLFVVGVIDTQAKADGYPCSDKKVIINNTLPKIEIKNSQPNITIKNILPKQDLKPIISIDNSIPALTVSPSPIPAITSGDPSTGTIIPATDKILLPIPTSIAIKDMTLMYRVKYIAEKVNNELLEKIKVNEKAKKTIAKVIALELYNNDIIEKIINNTDEKIDKTNMNLFLKQPLEKVLPLLNKLNPDNNRIALNNNSFAINHSESKETELKSIINSFTKENQSLLKELVQNKNEIKFITQKENSLTTEEKNKIYTLDETIIKSVENQKTTPSKIDAGRYNSLPTLDNLTIGLANFMIDRAKMELSFSFFYYLKENLNDFEILFPDTYRIFNKIQSTQYPQFIQTLRVSFNNDLSKLDTNLYKYLDDKLPEEKRKIVFETAKFLKNIKMNMSPINIIREINIDLKDPNLNSTIKTLKLLLTNMHDNRENLVSIDLNNFLNDDFQLDIFLNRLKESEEVKNINWEFTFPEKDLDDNVTYVLKKVKLTEIIEKIINESEIREEFKIYFTDLTNTVNVINKFTDEINKATDDKSRILFYQAYFNNIIELIDNGLNLKFLEKEIYKDQKYINFKNKIRDTSTLLASAGNLYFDVQQKKYESSIIDSINMFSVISSDQSVKTKDIIKYSTFMTSMVRADSPDAIKGAIESAAAPVGGSASKKLKPFSFEFSSYLGFSGGYNLNNKLPDFGINAPIGPNFNFGFGQGGSLSLFIPVLDIGSVVDFNLRNTSGFPTVKPENIVYPGLYLVYGGPFMLPISLGVGGQIHPLSDQSTSLKAFMAFDLPLFTFE